MSYCICVPLKSTVVKSAEEEESSIISSSIAIPTSTLAPSVSYTSYLGAAVVNTRDLLL